MVSRENAVIGVCIVAALVVGVAVSRLATLPGWTDLGTVVVVGVLLPTLLNEYADRREGTP